MRVNFICRKILPKYADISTVHKRQVKQDQYNIRAGSCWVFEKMPNSRTEYVPIKLNLEFEIFSKKKTRSLLLNKFFLY